MRDVSSASEVINLVQEVIKTVTNTTIIIDGRTLETIFNSPEAQDAFFNAAIQAPCVCVCRCSPQ